MPHYGIPDTRAFDRAVIRAGNAAFGLLCRAGAWSVHQLTDGHVPAEVVEQLGTPVQARKLADAGLWAPDGDGFQIADWTSSNRTADQVRARADAGREGGRRSGVARRAARNAPESDPNPGANAAKSSAPQEKTPAKNVKNGGSTPSDQAQHEPVGSGSAEPLPYPALPSRSPTGTRAHAHANASGPPDAQLANDAARAVSAWAEASPSPATRRERAAALGAVRDLLDAGADPDAVVAAATQCGRDGYGPQGIAVALRKRSRGSGAGPRRLNPADERLLRVQALKDNPDPRVLAALAEHDGVPLPAATGTDGHVVDADVVELRAIGGGRC